MQKETPANTQAVEMGTDNPRIYYTGGNADLSMSNEELVAAIQAGAAERIPELWEQVERLVKKRAWLMLTEINRPTVEIDDLTQSGFIAFLYAVERYDPAGGAKFSTYLCLCLKNAFGECLGIRTEKQKNDPINWAVSLSCPLADDKDSGKLFDIVPDPDANISMETVEEKMWQEQLHEAIESSMAALSDDQKETLWLRYYQDMTLTEIADMQGISFERVRQKENKALRILRQPKNACKLRPFYQYDFYIHTGLTAFRQSGLTVQERYVIATEEHQTRAELRRKAQEAKKFKKQCTEMMAQIDREVQEYVARMTPEEKTQLLTKYGA